MRRGVQFLADEIFPALRLSVHTGASADAASADTPASRATGSAASRAEPLETLHVADSEGDYAASRLAAGIATTLSRLPPSVHDTLASSALPAAEELLTPVLTALLTPSPEDSDLSTPSSAVATPRNGNGRGPRPAECEICARPATQIPLTAHHLVPRSVAAKAVKRGWHTAEKTTDLAWLCRACHSFVHGVASNEELAREWYSVELLFTREDVGRWAAWAGRVRYLKR